MQYASHVSAYYYGGFINLKCGECLDASRDYWEASLDRRCYDQ